jgi:probable addiction module antidote protein
MTIKLRSFDAAAYLDNEETIAAYISDALTSGDSDVLMSAISDVAKARGMARVAADAGVGRESLYKTLAPGSKPKVETLLKLLGALHVQLIAQPEARAQAVQPAKKTSVAKKATKSTTKPKSSRTRQISIAA